MTLNISEKGLTILSESELESIAGGEDEKKIKTNTKVTKGSCGIVAVIVSLFFVCTTGKNILRIM